MQLCAYLAAELIPLPLLYSIVGHEDKERLTKVVAGLEALSLVQVVEHDVDTRGLQIDS